MLVVVSPAKKLNMQSPSNLMSSRPIFSQNADELVSKMQALSVDDLKKTMDQGIIKSLGSKIKEYQKEWNGLKVKGDTELENNFLKLIDGANNKCLEAKKSIYEKLKLILTL